MHKSTQLNVATFKQLIPIAVIGSLNPILLFIALQFTQASFSPLIYAGVPAMTALYFAVVKKQTISSRKLLGIITGLTGVSIVVIIPTLTASDNNLSLFGNLLIFGASIAFLVYGLKSKQLQHEKAISPLALTFYFSLVTFLLSLPLAGFELITTGLANNITLVHWLSGVYMGSIGTGVFYLSYQYALKHGTALTASLFTYLQPFSTIVLAVLILDERITMLTFIGGTLAIVGAQLASQKKAFKENQP